MFVPASNKQQQQQQKENKSNLMKSNLISFSFSIFFAECAKNRTYRNLLLKIRNKRKLFIQYPKLSIQYIRTNVRRGGME